MKTIPCIVFITLLSLIGHATVVYDQPHNGTGTIYHSCWWDPDGSDYDQWVWDKFNLTNAQAITEIQWRGGFDPAYFGSGGPVVNFTVAIYADVANGWQPNVVVPPLVKYTTGGNANQTLAGTFGNVVLYDYRFTLPAPFQAVAGSNYWVQIEASQHGIPDWSIAAGSGGDGMYFRCIAAAGDKYYQRVPGDAAFKLLTTNAPTVTISASAMPADGGTILGAGTYPVGSTVSLIATPNPGYGFANWTVNGSVVSSSSTYNFTATTNRTLVANFVPAFTISTVAWPSYGGVTSGDGVYNLNSSVTVQATNAVGFVFVGWTEWGLPICESNSYTFAADADYVLEADFLPEPTTVVFDFDTGTPPLTEHQQMPATQTCGDLTVNFSAPSGAWSIQRYVFSYWVPASFSDNFLWPNTWGSTLALQFSQPITNFSVKFVTADLASETDTPTLLSASGYTNSTSSPAVCSNAVRGAWLSGSYPEGTLSVGSATPFDTVKLVIPPGQGAAAASLFFVDNIVVSATNAPPPALSIYPLDTNTVMLTWPANYSGYLLQAIWNLSGTNWSNTTNATSVLNGEKQAVITTDAAKCFYRLFHP